MSEKKSWKDRQLERQRKEQRAEQAYQMQKENTPKVKKRPKGKILIVACLLALIVVSVAVWQYALPSQSPNEPLPNVPAGAIRISFNGEVIPSTAPITNIGNNQYTLTGNIFAPIVIERNNIVLDGANYLLQGTNEQGSRGIDMTGRNGVTIKNMEIKGFDYGIYLYGASQNTLSNNDLTENYAGIWLVTSSNNAISENTLTNNEMWAIWLRESSNNNIYQNTLTSHGNYTISMRFSSKNNVYENYIANNNMGIFFYEASDNKIYHNSFVDNWDHASNLASTNIWDNGYPSGGNYWSDFKEIYPDATEIENSGIWNTAHVLDDDNKDNYPLVNR